jgi:sister-chromatid-cohesion protein PDS5
MFQFFLLELTSPKSGLSAPNGPYYSDYTWLLDSLSKAKSIALVTDLNKAEELMVDWFKRLYDVVR